jgi:hypothetical protein
MKRVGGIDDFALGCDCYAGCWGDHSETWPALRFESPAAASEAYRLVHRTTNGDARTAANGRPPHGSYVLVGCDLRFSTTALRDAHEKLLKETAP